MSGVKLFNLERPIKNILSVLFFGLSSYFLKAA